MLIDEFEKLLIETIDESLSSLGDSPKQSILFHLKNTFKIEKQEIPDNIGSFDVALKKLFGPGADFLEALIVKKLCEKANLVFKEPSPKDAVFAETIKSIKQMLAK